MAYSPPRRLRVFLLEDDFLARKYLTEVLESAMMEVTESCSNLTEFRARWVSTRCDLAVIDLKLGAQRGNRDGWMAATEIGLSNHPVPVLICSNYLKKPDDWREVPRYRSVAKLPKQPTVDELLRVAYRLIFREYPDAGRRFRIHPNYMLPTSTPPDIDSAFLVKNDALGYQQLVDPRFITHVLTVRGKSKICIFYEDQQIEFSQTLSGLLVIARADYLLQISRSTIISLRYLDGKLNDSLFVKAWGGVKEFSIGPTYLPLIERRLRSFRSK